MQAGGDKENKSKLIYVFGQNPRLSGIGQNWKNAPKCHTQGPHASQSYYNLVINASMHSKHTDENQYFCPV